jgi:hypothetical protein
MASKDEKGNSGKPTLKCPHVDDVHDVGEDTTLEALEPVQTNNVRPACFKSTAQEVLFVLTATMAIATGSLLAGAITVISSYVGRDLHMTTAEITWITSASSLSGGSFLLCFGRLADLFGQCSHFISVQAAY